MFNLYSFTDIAKDSGSPWNMQVDIFGELDAISTATYTSDYTFVAALQTMFNKLNDAHTQYYAPAPYQWYLLRPLLLSTSAVGGQLQFTVSGLLALNLGATTPWATFNTAANGRSVDFTGIVGKVITQINGVPVLDYIQQYADLAGTYKSSGVRLNAALKNGFYLFSMLSTPLTSSVAATETYTFSDDSTLTVDLPAWNPDITFSDIASLQALLPNTPAPGRRQSRRTMIQQILEEEEQLRSSRVPFTPVPPHIEILKRLLPEDQPVHESVIRNLGKRGTENVMASSTDEAVIFSVYTSDGGAAYVLLRINTFSTSLIGTNRQNWLTSYQNTIKAAFDYGQTNSISNLIIDVTGNGGGFVCLSTATRATMFPIYSGGIFSAGTGFAQGQFDYRLAGGTNSDYYNLVQALGGGFTAPCNSTVITDDSWFFPTSSHTRGGNSNLYTNLWAFYCYDSSGTLPFYYNDPNSINWTPTFYFSKVIVVTDGSCGSACSQYISKLQADSTATILSYGGRLDAELDTSSFHGGNVETWSTFVANANSISGTTGVTFTDLPTTAGTRFNFAEGYQPGASLPREFQSLPGLAQLQVWPIGGTSAYKLSVYEAATAYFSQISAIPTSGGTCQLATPGDTTGGSNSGNNNNNGGAAGHVESAFIQALSSLFNF
jgi:hypothetical protein